MTFGAIAAREREAVVASAEMLRNAGFPTRVVTMGSTPTATMGDSFEGVTEVRAGVYVFHDLVMAGLHVCAIDDMRSGARLGHRPRTACRREGSRRECERFCHHGARCS